jgi:hypothetical protein
MHKLHATQWSTVQDKEKFIAHFERFLNSGCKRTLFYKWFYVRLSMMFGFIAHYNINGFYSEKFSSKERIQDFLHSIKTWSCYGDPEWTYSDVEKILQEKLFCKK